MHALLPGLHLWGFHLLSNSLQAENVPKHEKFLCWISSSPTHLHPLVSECKTSHCGKRKNWWQLEAHFNAVPMYFWKSPNLTSSAGFHDFPQMLQSTASTFLLASIQPPRQAEFKNTQHATKHLQNTAGTRFTKSHGLSQRHLRPKTTSVNCNKITYQAPRKKKSKT